MKEEHGLNKVMPAIIAIVVMAGFFTGGGYVLYKALNMDVPDPKLFSILDMFVVATIAAMSTATGYFIMSTNSSKGKDQMLYNSTPSPAPTSQTVTSNTVSSSEEPKP